MRKLSVKLILSFAAFLTANLWLIGKGSAKGAADFLVSPAVEETILFILLQIIVILIYYIRPFTIRKYTVIPKELERDGMSLNKMWVRNRTTKTNGVSYIIQKGAAAIFTEEGQKQIHDNIKIYKQNYSLTEIIEIANG